VRPLFINEKAEINHFRFVSGITNFIHQKDTQINPMKKLLFFILILISLRTSFAQEGEDIGWVARFGAAGGFSPTLVFPNVDAINQQLTKLNIPTLSNGMFIYGGGGFAYVMIVDNLRLGGIGLSGSQSTSGKLSAIYLGNSFELKHSYSFGGLTIEYTLPFINKIAVSIGGIIGLGTQTVETFLNDGKYDWNSIWPPSVASSFGYRLAIKSELKNNFIAFTPTLNVDFPLSRFIAVRVGGGYVLPIKEKWEVNNGQEIIGIPGDMKANTFFIQTGIYFGLIAF